MTSQKDSTAALEIPAARTMNAFTTIERSYQLIGLLSVCEQAANSLDNVGDGPYRNRVTGGLGLTMELARDIAGEIHDVLERAEKPEGGDA